jgi:DNA modification methylase
VGEVSVDILVGDARERLKELPDASVHCCVTSPPYFGLRDYGVDGQMGLESTPAEFVAGMVELFREVRRVLRDDGTLWLNLGDSYNGQGSRDASIRADGTLSCRAGGQSIRVSGLKQKDLIGIPWRVAFALQEDGWYLRQDIIWSKPNPMPESVRDRCTKAHEYLFLLSKSPRYYFDQVAIAEGLASTSVARLAQNIEAQQGSDRVPGKTNGRMKAVQRQRGIPPRHAQYTESSDQSGLDGVGRGVGRNKRSVWTVATQPFSGAHFATFPSKLVEPCILAGCPERCCVACGAPWVRMVERELVPTAKAAKTFVVDDRDREADRNDQGSNRQRDGHKPGFAYATATTGFAPSCGCGSAPVAGMVLDPFGGAGTTGLVTARLGRHAILIELNAEYADLARDRLRAGLCQVQSDSPEREHDDGPLFGSVVA